MVVTSSTRNRSPPRKMLVTTTIPGRRAPGKKDLKAARIKLGDVTVDTSKEDTLDAKVGAIMEELYAAKSDLEAAQKRAASYQSIAKSNKEQLTELTAASTNYKDETTAALERLRKFDSSKQEVVAK